MKKFYIVFIALILIISCDSGQKGIGPLNESNNVLLADIVTVRNVIELKNDLNPQWLSGFNKEDFINNVFSSIFTKNNIKCYKSWEDFDTSKYSIQDLKLRMSPVFREEVFDTVNRDLSEIKELIFKEEWVFDSETFKFKKNILAWGPIRIFLTEGDFKEEEKRRKMICVFKKDSLSENKKLIAEDFTYVFEINKGELSALLSRTGFDKLEFFKFILENIKASRLNAYDPIFLVDKSKRKFSVDKLKSYAAISLDPKEFNDEVNKFIFIEDWYFDDTSFNLTKIVKGIGFVADRYNNGLREDKILFFIFQP